MRLSNHEVKMPRYYGSVIREIRESKKITLDMLADEEVSKSMLSKFERDQVDISLSRFIHIIEKLHVTFSEFMLIANEYKPDEFMLFIKEVTEACENESLIKLTRLMEQQKNKWEKTSVVYYYLNYIMVKALRNDISKDFIIEEDVRFLSNYLFECESWGNYELIIYGNSMTILPPELVITLSKELLNKILVFKDAKGNYETVLNILLNTILVCLEKRDFKNALFFLSYLRNSNIPETYFLERLIISLVEGLYEFLKGNKEVGMNKIQKSLDFMSFIGANTYYMKFKTYLNTYL